MAQSVSTFNPKKSPDKIRDFLREQFKNLSQNELKKMKELQEVVKKHSKKGKSLADELVEDRRKEDL
ncbi:MAG: hypothetical protein V4591_01405 [Bdellovibrionota bacterium]